MFRCRLSVGFWKDSVQQGYVFFVNFLCFKLAVEFPVGFFCKGQNHDARSFHIKAVDCGLGKLHLKGEKLDGPAFYAVFFVGGPAGN